jgi:hypothetical protein
VAAFWQQMEACFAELLACPDLNQRFEPREELLPTITINPEPAAWPDPQVFLHDDEERA